MGNCYVSIATASVFTALTGVIIATAR